LLGLGFFVFVGLVVDFDFVALMLREVRLRVDVDTERSPLVASEVR
jgi:hypothetical protein